MFESLERLTKVRGMTLDLIQRKEWTVIDGDLTLEEIQSKIRDSLGL